MTMMRNAQSKQAAMAVDLEGSPRVRVDRPKAPTPEQTNHWLRNLDESMEQSSEPRFAEGSFRSDQAGATSRSPSPCSPSAAASRPRSPTPTKMLAWEEATATSPTDEDTEGRGDHTDGLIAKLIGACQTNDIKKVFSIYKKLGSMKVQLYEGVYKLIIECCMREQQLGHAMQFYEKLRRSGQRVSERLVLVLIRACAKEQHGDKVHAIWSDWCPASEPIGKNQCEVLLETVAALIETMSPDLAREVLQDAMARPQGVLAHGLDESGPRLEELLQLNEAAADEARMNGMLMGDLAGQFHELDVLLQSLRSQSEQEAGRTSSMRAMGEMLLMEDVDLDLDLATA